MPLFYDLETTGLDPGTARIVELAAADGRELPADGTAARGETGGAELSVPPGEEDRAGKLRREGADFPRETKRILRRLVKGSRRGRSRR